MFVRHDVRMLFFLGDKVGQDIWPRSSVWAWILESVLDMFLDESKETIPGCRLPLAEDIEKRVASEKRKRSHGTVRRYLM